MKISVKKLTLLAMLAALSYIIVALVRIPVVPATPFLTYEPKAVVSTVGAFPLGPPARFGDFRAVESHAGPGRSHLVLW